VAQLSAAQTALSASLEKILGTGQWVGEAFTLTYASGEPVTQEQIEIPSYIGLETVFHFQLEGKQTKAYGQWILKPEEALPVIQILMKNHIEVTATHSELTAQTPARVRVDFWAEGEPDKIAKSLREALQQTNLAGMAPNANPPTQQP
jgi:hypothetical protein